MQIAISSGHAARVAGAVGLLDEVRENRRVTSRVAELLCEAGHEVSEFHDNTSASASTNVARIVAWHNRQQRDRDVSVHFNAFEKTDRPRGTEVLYYSAQALAAQISKAIADASGLINRGAKERKDLGFLRGTAKPAVLLEVCFVDSAADVALYREHFGAICGAVAEALVR